MLRNGPVRRRTSAGPFLNPTIEMSWNNNLPDSDGDDNEEDDIHLTGRDGILFLVDCSKSMFETTEVDADEEEV